MPVGTPLLIHSMLQLLGIAQEQTTLLPSQTDVGKVEVILTGVLGNMLSIKLCVLDKPLVSVSCKVMVVVPV